MCIKALSWIKHRYDCYYIEKQDEDGAFYYLEQKLKETEHE